jgi:hypothetical protein
MHQALRVDGGETRGGFARDLPKFIRGVTALRLPAPDVRVQGLARDVLHHEDGSPRARREVVHAAHVRVTHGAREQELLAERFVVARHARFLAHHLERGRLLGRPVVREEHLAHTALPEALADLVPVVHDRALAERRGIAGRVRHGSELPTQGSRSVVDLCRPCNVLTDNSPAEHAPGGPRPGDPGISRQETRGAVPV